MNKFKKIFERVSKPTSNKKTRVEEYVLIKWVGDHKTDVRNEKVVVNGDHGNSLTWDEFMVIYNDPKKLEKLKREWEWIYTTPASVFKAAKRMKKLGYNVDMEQLER